LGYDEGSPLAQNLELAEQKVLSISQNIIKGNFIHIKDILEDTFERIADIHDRRERGEDVQRGISSGFVDLDNLISGFQKSDLIILAARPSMGKTAFALNIAENIALKSKKMLVFFP
jgi:replicative DNA helicase